MNKINFTNEQIEYIKNASDYVEMLCGGRGIGKTHKLINEMQDKINNLQSKIDKANEILEEILVVSDWEHKGRFRPVKGTTAQDVYKTIVKLNELLETPRRINYELLKEDK